MQCYRQASPWRGCSCEGGNLEHATEGGMRTREESTQGLEDQEDEEGERQAELHTLKQRRTTARQQFDNSQATVRQMKS